VALRHVTKRFPGIVALDRVSLDFHRGEIHVLLGENGAGKSTLVAARRNAATGRRRDPRAREPHGHRLARRSMDLGIGTVFQRVLLVPSLTVIENLMLGGSWRRLLARAAARSRFDELSALLGTRIDADAPVSGLALGEQQQVEIMRALWRDEKLLLLDEPTSMLTPQGVADLGRMMRRLKERGVAVILITHKLLEAFEFGDRISVLRLGRLAGEIEPQRLQAMSESQRTETVISMMFGVAAGSGAMPLQGHEQELAMLLDANCVVPGVVDRRQPAALAVQGLATAPDFAETPLHEVSFELWPGEILGIAGVDGNGQRHLAEVLAASAPCGMDESIWPVPISHGARTGASAARIRYVTDDRLGEGTVGTFSVATNLSSRRSVFHPIGGMASAIGL